MPVTKFADIRAEDLAELIEGLFLELEHAASGVAYKQKADLLDLVNKKCLLEGARFSDIEGEVRRALGYVGSRGVDRPLVDEEKAKMREIEAVVEKIVQFRKGDPSKGLGLNGKPVEGASLAGIESSLKAGIAVKGVSPDSAGVVAAQMRVAADPSKLVAALASLREMRGSIGEVTEGSLGDGFELQRIKGLFLEYKNSPSARIDRRVAREAQTMKTACTKALRAIENNAKPIELYAAIVEAKEAIEKAEEAQESVGGGAIVAGGKDRLQGLLPDTEIIALGCALRGVPEQIRRAIGVLAEEGILHDAEEVAGFIRANNLSADAALGQIENNRGFYIAGDPRGAVAKVGKIIENGRNKIDERIRQLDAAAARIPNTLSLSQEVADSLRVYIEAEGEKVLSPDLRLRVLQQLQAHAQQFRTIPQDQDGIKAALVGIKTLLRGKEDRAVSFAEAMTLKFAAGDDIREFQDILAEQEAATKSALYNQDGTPNETRAHQIEELVGQRFQMLSLAIAELTLDEQHAILSCLASTTKEGANQNAGIAAIEALQAGIPSLAGNRGLKSALTQLSAFISGRSTERMLGKEKGAEVTLVSPEDRKLARQQVKQLISEHSTIVEKAKTEKDEEHKKNHESVLKSPTDMYDFAMLGGVKALREKLDRIHSRKVELESDRAALMQRPSVRENGKEVYVANIVQALKEAAFVILALTVVAGFFFAGFLAPLIFGVGGVGAAGTALAVTATGGTAAAWAVPLSLFSLGVWCVGMKAAWDVSSNNQQLEDIDVEMKQIAQEEELVLAKIKDIKEERNEDKELEVGVSQEVLAAVKTQRAEGINKKVAYAAGEGGRVETENRMAVLISALGQHSKDTKGLIEETMASKNRDRNASVTEGMLSNASGLVQHAMAKDFGNIRSGQVGSGVRSTFGPNTSR